ncbi:MAG: hypothetical protein H6Q89_2727, partial [Myxococcaceae bacterium]|nr:hypothetical protein [Myxococcaceae bacterium]
EDAITRARERRQEAASDRLDVQAKQLAAIELRLDTWEKRLETASTATEKLRTGEAGRQQMARAIESYRPEIQRCVQGQLKRTPTATNLGGTLHLTIDGQGGVSQASADGKLGGTYLEGCLQQVARSWRFPASGEAYQLEAPLIMVGR